VSPRLDYDRWVCVLSRHHKEKMMLPAAIEVLTLFVEDMASTRAFYEKVFAPEVVFEDEAGAVLRFSGMMVNLLQAESAPELVTPTPIGGPHGGPRMLVTVKVDDCDAACAELAGNGIALLNGPIDRPWGRRTAAFADPSGNVWEVAQDIA
jgi:catechol 2,3-dioxygenase-like lactoylglutathione lyase family enzyme